MPASPTAASPRPPVDEWPPSTEGSAPFPRTEPSSATVRLDDAPAGAELTPSWLSDLEPLPSPETSPPAPWEHATAEHQPFAADTPIEAHAVDTSDDDLDDDAFFASLREAVRDDAPLGALDERTAFFDDEPADTRRSHFRRRR